MNTIPVSLLHPPFVQTLATYLSTPEKIRGRLLDPDVAVLYDWMVDHGISTEPLPELWLMKRNAWEEGAFSEPHSNLQHWVIWDAYTKVLETARTREAVQELLLIKNWLLNPQDPQNQYAISRAFEQEPAFHMDLANAIRFPGQIYYFCTSACFCRNPSGSREPEDSDTAKLRYQMLNRLDGPEHQYLPPVPPVWVS